MESNKFYSDRATRIPRRNTRPPDEDDAYSPLPPPPIPPRAESPSSGSSRRRRRHARDERATAGRLLWFGLACAVCIYVAFLAVSILRDRMYREQAAAEAARVEEKSADPVAMPEAVEQALPAIAAVEAEPFLDNQIKAWKQALVMVDEAATLRKSGRNLDAAERLETAHAIAGDVIDIQLALAGLRVDQQRYAEARTLLLSVLSHQPDNRAARLMLAQVLIDSGLLEDALVAAKWILEDDPYSEEGHRIAATAFINLGRTEKALMHLDRLVLLNRDNMLSRNALGQAYLELGRINEALKVFEEVKQTDPSNSQAHFYSAVCYARQGEMPGLAEVMSGAASRFGRDFVLAWVRSPEFDGIRDTVEFRILLRRLGEPPAAADPEASLDSTASTAQLPATL
ncbi:MAG: tetratricopeptide repeat protein [Kiritimatiellae bacterium]|nr:tetratricopeptide repeat protein [Kiritimatiellia bacterium]